MVLVGVMVMVMVHKINKTFGIIDTNPTLQIIAADWIEEYYDDQYLAFLLRKNQVLISKETFDGIDSGWGAGDGYGSGNSAGFGGSDFGSGYDYGYDSGSGDGFGNGSGNGNGNGNNNV